MKTINSHVRGLAVCAISATLVACSNNETQQQTRIKASAGTAIVQKGQWPSNIRYNANKIEFVNSNTLGSFGKKWKNGDEVIRIAHFGDSHIQPGWQIGPLRDAFQAIKGNAGRGMIFPYAIAKTYSQEDYSSTFTGTWKTANSIQQPPKIGVGVSGFVARTFDAQAQVKFQFKKVISSAPINARVFFKTNSDYQLSLISGSEVERVDVNPKPNLQFVDIKLNGLQRDLTLVVQAQDAGGEFELHGISLENEDQAGVIYHNLGVGGAAYNAILQQKWFDQQFPELKADLVILDWGTNNVIYTNQLADDLEDTIRSTIHRVRALNPNAAILLTSVQEANYKKRNITVSEQYANLVRRIAKEEGTLFYDWYTVAGGHDSINQWRSLGFASKDGIHLNAKGYRIRAKLLGDALMQAVK